jgi:hypothetical protein
MELSKLKKQYESKAKQYSLPKFNEVNESFEIEKIDKETEIILRVVRKVMMEKIVSSLNFLEMLLNPVNAPRMYFPFLKGLTQEDKKIIDRTYLSLSNLSVSSLECEISYGEKSEAEQIKKIFKTWKEIQPDFKKIFNKIKKPNKITKKEKSYFG